MTNIQKIVASSVAGAGILMNVVFPAFAATIEITGNGYDSTNKAYVDISQSTSVVQSNDAHIDNHINVDASTGKNEASKNTGGTVSVETGDAKSDVTVSNTANANQADVACCGAGSVDVKISGNGADTYNKVDLDLGSGDPLNPDVYVVQDNKAKIDNHVDADSSTGGNEAEKNTGGSVSIKTGDAKSDVTVTNTANANSAMVGGGSQGGSLSAWILDNGYDSTNKIYLDYGHSVFVGQENHAYIDNDVDASAKTGWNEAEKNTGGNSSIKTGDATLTVDIDNMANFNWADVDCGGCLLGDLTAKIAGNGDDSYNKIKADLSNDLLVEQGNCVPDYPTGGLAGIFHLFKKGKKPDCGFDNSVDAYAKTGGNELEKSTGAPTGDPSISTGDAEGTVNVDNSANFNSYGSEAPSWFPEFPEMPEFPDVQVGFNWAFFWAWLGAYFG